MAVTSGAAFGLVNVPTAISALFSVKLPVCETTIVAVVPDGTVAYQIDADLPLEAPTCEPTALVAAIPPIVTLVGAVLNALDAATPTTTIRLAAGVPIFTAAKVSFEKLASIVPFELDAVDTNVPLPPPPPPPPVGGGAVMVAVRAMMLVDCAEALPAASYAETVYV